jgi:putative ribosome biogenesis GTPase RsgA
VKLDEAQLKDQNALQVQLKHEEQLLKEYQEKQKAKLSEQHEREKATLDDDVKEKRRQLDKQFVEESTKLVNERLARKQELTRQHIREVDDFKSSSDPELISLSSFSAFSDRGSIDRASTRSNRSSKSVSVGTSSV